MGTGGNKSQQTLNLFHKTADMVLPLQPVAPLNGYSTDSGETGLLPISAHHSFYKDIQLDNEQQLY